MKLTRKETTQYANILKLSSWGFAIVFASFLFLYLGYKIDDLLHTAPSFTFGLFVLALFMSIGRLYQDAWNAMKQAKKC